MKTLGKLFSEELKSIYNAEKQCAKFFGVIEEQAYYSDLKKFIHSHMQFYEESLERIKQIFVLIDSALMEVYCEGMKGIIEEGSVLLKNKHKPHVRDAAIICIMQKLCHYKMASYSSLRNFAEHLDFDGLVIEYLQGAVNAEMAHDKKLAKLAQGSFFAAGVNAEAADESD